MSAPIIALIVAALIVAFLIYLYNSLVTARTRVAEGWSDIDVQLKRRLDLIPNLVETVKGYQTHEQQTLLAVTEARSRVLEAKNVHDRTAAEQQLGVGLSNLLINVEQYPDLKASANFLELQRELTDTEDKIQAARRFYNGLVRDYNIKLQVFPSNMFARLFSFAPAEFFELDPTASREPVKVSFA